MIVVLHGGMCGNVAQRKHIVINDGIGRIVLVVVVAFVTYIISIHIFARECPDTLTLVGVSH